MAFAIHSVDLEILLLLTVAKLRTQAFESELALVVPEATYDEFMGTFGLSFEA